MELIYSMRRKPLKCEPPHFESPTDREVIRPICVISTCNIIAFSSPTKLSDSEGDTWGGHVYVCDLDTPWDSHEVTNTVHPISALEWDIEGKQLLVGTIEGEVSIFGQKEYLLNEWQCLYTASFPGEHIVKSVFFHNGRRIISMDKKLDSPITERLQMTRSTPTLKGFGGVACEGACIITATGLLGALTPPAAADTTRALVATESLRGARDHITDATISHKNGNLLIAAVCVRGGGGARRASGVRCYVCSVRGGAPPARPHAAALCLQPLPALTLTDTVPASITWCLREDTDSLLIAGSKLTLWKLTERSHPVHKLLSKGPLQGSTTPGGGQKPSSDCFNTVVWQQTAAWPVEEAAVQVCSSLNLSVLATTRHLHLYRDNHHLLCSRAVSTGGAAAEPPAAGTPPKKTKYGGGTTPTGAACAIVSSVQMSHLGGVVVCIDTHAQLHVYKLPQPWADIPSGVAVQHATAVLEYALVSGYDCLDILLTLKHNVVEAVYDRLTETFQRQLPAFQQFYYHSWLKLRIALCRLLPSGQGSASWLSMVQALHAARAAALHALRPDDRGEPAPSPAAAPLAALANMLDDHAHDDKTLLALEAKSEPSGEAVSLQALRRPLQRSVDVALTALAALPHHAPQGHGYELISDPTAVTLLRKLVVIARASGRGGEALSRPLARLASGNAKPDLVEECAALAAQLPSPRVWESLPRCCVSAPHLRPWPLYFEYGVEPEALRYTPEPPAYAQGCDTTPSITMDSIRYMYLGGGSRPARWRQCGRCGARALPAALPARHPLQRAYDGRFLLACRCGGKWTLFSNI